MNEPKAPPPAPESTVEAVKPFVEALLQRVEPAAVFTVEQQGRHLMVELHQAAAFADREGQSVQALEHLLDLHVRRNLNRDVHVRVDIDNFRQRRSEELRVLAQQLAAQVIVDKRSVRLDPMSAWERKIVHEALEELSGVRTRSEGRAERRVVIDVERP